MNQEGEVFSDYLTKYFPDLQMKKASKACKMINSGEIEDGDNAKSGSESTGPSEGSHEKDSRSILSSGCKLAGDLISQDSPQRDLHAKETVAT